MSNWECYCAICGGPFYEVQITKKSKSARARRRQQQKRDSQLAEKGKGDDSAYNNNDEYDENNDEVEGEDGYDAEIINEEETQWVQTLHIIGFDKNAPGVSKYATQSNSILREAMQADQLDPISPDQEATKILVRSKWNLVMTRILITPGGLAATITLMREVM